jgi:GNAT superfamily N-acetyltransferase
VTDPRGAAEEAEGIRTATEDEIPELARATTLAFAADPVLAYLQPDESRRAGRFERAMNYFLRTIWFQYGACYTTPGVVGASFWVPPGEAHMSVWEQLRTVPGFARTFGRDVLRWLRVVTLLDRNHPREDHWYLPIVGVVPEWQGRGLGTALMRPILDRCDREGIPAYLEASTPRNRVCYERQGFVARQEIHIPDGTPMWLMWRDPQSRPQEEKEARSADLSQVHRN